MFTNTWSLITTPWQREEGELLRVSGGTSNNKFYLYTVTRTGITTHNCRLHVYDLLTDTWKSVTKRRYYRVVRNLFGQIFLVFQRRSPRPRRMPPELRLSVLDPTSLKETKLVSINKGLYFDFEYSYLMALSRGSRMRITENKTANDKDDVYTNFHSRRQPSLLDPLY